MKTIRYVIAIALLSAGTLLATASFDPDFGTGSISAADIRTAYNWQTINTQRANSLSFSEFSYDRYECVCSIPGHDDVIQYRQVRAYKTLYRNPEYSGNQITGVAMNGYSYIASDQVPYVGQNCNQSYWHGTFSSVTLANGPLQYKRLYMTTNAPTQQPSSQIIWSE
jgi:hypothetical protein